MCMHLLNLENLSPKSAFLIQIHQRFYTIEHKTRGYTQQSYYLPDTYTLQSLGGNGSVKEEQEEK